MFVRSVSFVESVSASVSGPLGVMNVAASGWEEYRSWSRVRPNAITGFVA
jgi:hypothetical protein